MYSEPTPPWLTSLLLLVVAVTISPGKSIYLLFIRTIAMCVSVCVSVRENISGTARPNFTRFSARVAFGLDSIPS